MTAVRSGWEHVTFGDVIISIRNGYNVTQNKEGRGVPLTRIETIATGQIDADRVGFGEGVPSDYKLCDGDILFSHINSAKHIGKTALYRAQLGELYHGINLLRFQISAHVCPQFFETQCRWMRAESIFSLRAQHAVNQASLNQTAIRSFSFLLPSANEQRRIVAKIDSLSAKSRRARAHLAHIPRLVEKYKQAILAAAFRGELTREWRQIHGAQYPWTTTPAGSVIKNVVAGKNLRCEERPPVSHERGVVKVSAVTWGSFDPQATKTLPVDFDPPDHTRVRSGDFLISRANTLELVGAVVIVQDTPPNLFLSDKILRLEMEEGAKRWMLWFLRSPSGRAAIEEVATGNQLSMRNLSQTALRGIDIPWPNDRERVEIVRRIETAFAWIDRLASEAGSARKLIDRLDQAVLAKAFRGELVPQDPTDEPASVLLEKIKTERSAAIARPRKAERQT